eukprot:4783643-Amphidinium_carterae.1
MGAKKAAGPDHWRVQELLCLPEQANSSFVRCLTATMQQGGVPAALNHTAIAPIPKQAKETPKLSKIRPLSIYPVPFRAYLSAAWNRVKTESKLARPCAICQHTRGLDLHHGVQADGSHRVGSAAENQIVWFQH